MFSGGKVDEVIRPFPMRSLIQTRYYIRLFLSHSVTLQISDRNGGLGEQMTKEFLVHNFGKGPLEDARGPVDEAWIGTTL